MIERVHLQSLIRRIEEPRRFVQVIVGPRQVGKTTLVGQLVRKLSIAHVMLSADGTDALSPNWLEAQWEATRIKLDASGSTILLVIDEIQKIRNWSERIKALWDADTADRREIKVVLLGSSRLLMQQGLTESLAGRFEITHMGHWSLAEMQEAFDWTPEQYAWYGGYPGSASLIGDEMRWKAYVKQALIEPAISKDILLMSRVDKPALLKQVFEIGCLYSGQVLSFTKILGQLQDAGNTTTLSHYLRLLDTAGLLSGLEKYAGDIVRKRSSSPKFQVYNTALISSQSDESFDQSRSHPSQWGRIVESAIGAHLLNQSISGNYTVNYWREQNQGVDFILERNGNCIALEVKSGLSKSHSGMQAFHQKFKATKQILISGDNLSWQEFLLIAPADLF